MASRKVKSKSNLIEKHEQHSENGSVSSAFLQITGKQETNSDDNDSTYLSDSEPFSVETSDLARSNNEWHVQRNEDNSCTFTEICAVCVMKKNGQKKATHFCKHCDSFGRYICSGCMTDHDIWASKYHDVVLLSTKRKTYRQIYGGQNIKGYVDIDEDQNIYNSENFTLQRHREMGFEYDESNINGYEDSERGQYDLPEEHCLEIRGTFEDTQQDDLFTSPEEEGYFYTLLGERPFSDRIKTCLEDTLPDFYTSPKEEEQSYDILEGRAFNRNKTNRQETYQCDLDFLEEMSSDSEPSNIYKRPRLQTPDKKKKRCTIQ